MKVTVNGDKNINGKLYSDGDPYEGRKDIQKLRFLYQRGFISVEGEGSEAVTGSRKLKFVGGGMYELPNGERVRGRLAAQEALRLLRNETEATWSKGK